MPTALRILGVTGCVVLELAAIFGPSRVPEDPVNWAPVAGLTLVLVVTVAFARRSCVLDHDKLIAKGRFATREVDLKDLRQAAVGLGQSIWVQTHHPLDDRGGDVLCLRTIPKSKFTLMGLPGGEGAVRLIRARAEEAGARLDPPVRNPTRAPSKKPLVFSI
ncbi:hypothetical protein [Actinocrispum sp. NPDC049592]|uniref:hypothetical protein n=1 Tax=Actinocrispum sp. NPDC049592 TaxID=3154835 RepID=UPI003448048B